MELLNIDKGDPEVREWAQHFGIGAGKSLREITAELEDLSHPLWDYAIKARRQELLERAQGMNRMSGLAQLKQQVEEGVSSVALRAARTTVQGRFEKSLIGDMKKRINAEKKRHFGSIDSADEEKLRLHYRFVKNLEQSLVRGEVPSWLR